MFCTSLGLLHGPSVNKFGESFRVVVGRDGDPMTVEFVISTFYNHDAAREVPFLGFFELLVCVYSCLSSDLESFGALFLQISSLPHFFFCGFHNVYIVEWCPSSHFLRVRFSSFLPLLRPNLFQRPVLKFGDSFFSLVEPALEFF